MNLEIQKMDDEKLLETAKRLGVEFPPALNRSKKEDLVEKALIKHTLELEAQARAESQIKAEKVLKEAGIKPKNKLSPSPETIAIEASKKVYAIFRNLTNPGNDELFNKGGKYNFHIFDGKVHILPEWLINNLRTTVANTTPKFANRKNPVSGETVSVISGYERKWLFEVLTNENPETKPPDNAEFGVVLDDTVLEKLGVLAENQIVETEFVTKGT